MTPFEIALAAAVLSLVVAALALDRRHLAPLASPRALEASRHELELRISGAVALLTPHATPHAPGVPMLKDLDAALADLAAQAAANTDAEASAVTIIQGLAAQLDQAAIANDLSAVLGLTARLKASAGTLAAAITANTPAAAAPAPAPVAPSAPSPSAPTEPASPGAAPEPSPAASIEPAPAPVPPAPATDEKPSA
ncbi:MAG TPA: hypothetical protein VGI39_03190 [Polyangiaceae bacterium]|jgi:hypothetical protein